MWLCLKKAIGTVGFLAGCLFDLWNRVFNPKEYTYRKAKEIASGVFQSVFLAGLFVVVFATSVSLGLRADAALLISLLSLFVPYAAIYLFALLFSRRRACGKKDENRKKST